MLSYIAQRNAASDRGGERYSSLITGTLMTARAYIDRPRLYRSRIASDIARLQTRNQHHVGENQMGSFSAFHWIVVAGVVALLFGRGKISGLMGDVAQGIKSFKKGMAEDDGAPIDAPPPAAVAPIPPAAPRVIDHHIA